MAQKIYSNDGELHSSQQKGPAEPLPIEGQLELLLPPAQYWLTSCTGQSWTTRKAG
jgi:hypothetical protein